MSVCCTTNSMVHAGCMRTLIDMQACVRARMLCMLGGCLNETMFFANRARCHLFFYVARARGMVVWMGGRMVLMRTNVSRYAQTFIDEGWDSLEAVAAMSEVNNPVLRVCAVAVHCFSLWRVALLYTGCDVLINNPR